MQLPRWVWRRALGVPVGWYYLYALAGHVGFQRGIFLLLLVDRGFSQVQIGSLESLLFVSNLIFELPCGFFADRYGHRAALIAGHGLLIVNAIGTVLCSSYAGYAVLFVLEGLALALISGSDAALLFELLRAEQREQEYVSIAARARALAHLSLGGTMAAGGFLLAFSWSAVYGALIVGWIIAIVALARLRLAPHHAAKEGSNAASPWRDLRGFVTDPQSRPLLGLNLALGMFTGVLTPYFVYSPLLFQGFGARPRDVSLLNGAVELITLLELVLLSKVLVRLPVARTLLWSLAVGCVAIALNVLHRLPITLAVYVMTMVGPTIAELLLENWVQQRVPSSIRATVLSFQSFASSVFIALAYAAYGAMMEVMPIDTALSCGSLVVLAALLLTAMYFRTPAQRLESQP